MSGGVGDYTEQLIRHWPRGQEFEFIIPKHSAPALAMRDSHNVHEVAADRHAVAARLPEAGAVLLQYSAYGFSHYGYPRWLVDALLDWKRKRRGRLCVMFHEIWTFWPWWNKNYPIQLLHRRALRRLLDVADAVFTSTASQADHLSRLAPGIDVDVLPVGSNIIPTDLDAQSKRAGAAVVFGMQSTRLRALTEMASGLRALAAAQRLTEIITVGAGNSTAQDAQERSLLESFGMSGGFRRLGEKTAAEISANLSTCEFGIAAQDPLSYTKSGTFMAYAAHGLNILSNYADPTAPEPMSLLISPAQLMGNLDPAEVTTRAQKLRSWYERTASWPQIAQKIAAVFDRPSTEGAGV